LTRRHRGRPQPRDIRVRRTAFHDDTIEHIGALEQPHVRRDIQQIMEGGIVAFVRRERRYNNDLNTYRAVLHAMNEDNDTAA
jgi:transcription initiation factor IIE alpha subunit